MPYIHPDEMSETVTNVTVMITRSKGKNFTLQGKLGENGVASGNSRNGAVMV